MEKTAIKYTPVDMGTRKKLDFKAGDSVRVWSKILEKGKTRLQAFEGLVLARKHGAELGATFTVRKVASGVGVERIFPLYSPNVDKIEILKRSKTRRSKLYYIRTKAVKEVKKRLKSITLSKEESDTESNPTAE
jgi:large subunit ribosomal protein L19